MPYLNYEGSSQQKEISKALKEINVLKERKRWQGHLDAVFRQMYEDLASRTDIDTTDGASSHPADNGNDEKTGSGDEISPWKEKKTEHRSSSQRTESDDENESSSSDSESSNDTDESIDSEIPRKSKSRMRAFDKIKTKLHDRLTNDIDLISSYIDHEFPLHVSVLPSLRPNGRQLEPDDLFTRYDVHSINFITTCSHKQTNEIAIRWCCVGPENLGEDRACLPVWRLREKRTTTIS